MQLNIPAMETVKAICQTPVEQIQQIVKYAINSLCSLFQTQSRIVVCLYSLIGVVIILANCVEAPESWKCISTFVELL